MKSYRLLIISIGLLLVISSCNDSAKTEDMNKASEITLTSDKDKFNYGLGMIIGERVLKQYDEVDYEIMLQGIIAQSEKKQTLLTLAEASNLDNG